LALVLAQQGAFASVPLSVASNTIKAATLFAAGHAAAGAISAPAARLAEGVLKTMLLTKLKLVTAVLMVVAVLGTGAAALAPHVLAETATDQPVAQPTNQPTPEKLVLAAAPAAQPQEKKAPAGQAVKENKQNETKPQFAGGVVKAVDATKNTLTITHKDGETTYTVAPNAHISIDSKAGQLAGLPLGAHVHLTLLADHQTVGDISAEGSSIFAAVKSVDTVKNTITVAGGPADGKTYSVTADTKITIDGKPGALSGIPTGASLHALNLCVDEKTAHGINVEGPALYSLLVTAVDAAKNTITFGDKAPMQVAGKTITVAADADIRIDGKPAKLSSLPNGAFVNVLLTVDHSTARVVDAEGPAVGGCGGACVKAVDAAKNTITFEAKGPAEVAGKTFAVAPDAYILIDGRPGKLTELPNGSYVTLVLTVDQSMAHRVHAQGPHLSGLLKAVDVQKKTLTIDHTTYPVAKDANIVIDGKVGQLAALPTGYIVSVTLHVDQKTIGNIHVSGK
jgi:hypothetical protein